LQLCCFFSIAARDLVLLKGHPDVLEKTAGRERLFEHVDCPALHGVDGDRYRCEARDDEERLLAPTLSQLLPELKTVPFRQLKIEHETAGPRGPDHFERLIGRGER